MTPTLSVEAPQERSISPLETAVAVSVPGCDGGSCRDLRDRGALVGLDLGGGEGDVVDADVVDQAGEELAVETVPADLQRVRRGGDRAGMGRRGDLGPVDIQAQRRPVIGLGQERPGVGGQRGGAEGVGVAAARDHARRPGATQFVEVASR